MQLADLLLIWLLKPLFSTETIRHGIDQVTAGDFPKQAYDNFIDVLNEALKNLGQGQPETPAKTLNDKLMQVAADTIVNRIQSEQLLRMIEKPIKPIKQVK